MIRPKICFAALAVIRDAETNTVSAFNILEGLIALGFPFFLQSLRLFVLWQREPGDPARVDGTFRVRIEEQELATAPMNADFQGGLLNRTVIKLDGLIIPRAGSLHMVCELTTGARAEYQVNVEAPAPVVQAQDQQGQR